MKMLHLLVSVCALMSMGHAADVGEDLRRLRDAYGSIGKQAGAAFASSVPLYTADEAVAGIVAAAVLRREGAFSEGAYATVQAALRYRVEGLAMSLRQAPGAGFSRSASAPTSVVVELDLQNVTYSKVDIVYTYNKWATTRAASFQDSSNGYTALLSAIPVEGEFEYVLHYFGTDGRDYWVNNGRDQGVFGGPLAFNFRFDLAALFTPSVTPSRPAFAQLVRSFAGSGSDEGATVTNLEFSLMVEQMTWEGGRGVHVHEDVLPAFRELAAMEREGVAFKAGVADSMRGFLQQQAGIFHRATYVPAKWTRADDGFLTVSAPTDGSVKSRWHYSTDGWNTVHKVTCRPGSDPAAHDCKLGYIPPHTLLAFAVRQDFADGTHRWLRVVGASGNLNFFMPIPN